MLSVGIDVGSVNTKVLIYDSARDEVVARCVAPTGMKPREQAQRVFEFCVANAGLERSALGHIVATGYARQAVDFARQTVTEITATGRGIRKWHPSSRTVIDIGGQDSKVIALDEQGRVQDFVMNDRCAAGTGSFLEFIARALNVPIEQFGELSARSQKPVLLSSLCVVMAESEILSLVAADVPREDIIAGLHLALATRVVNMAARVNVLPEVIFTGGTALNSGLRQALERVLGLKVQSSQEPLFAAAMGAALLGADTTF
ncbi:MAG: acyl-CoA dehydratase activase [candidate division WOR-3 bacterium]|jgi:predicted CoA-substrate-specific enzyme activase|nr:acyl-CoA dehydratase activase [candidate division WOR-3 bacterium]MCR4424283.1 acyl-CoA dehydratase activase [candidate division WOR-3 bacterium]MDH7519737.1 acyl-CoA dehydratase activase [bacterium]